jgi:hypothetical protein
VREPEQLSLLPDLPATTPDPPDEGRRSLRARQVERIENGWHPLSYGGRRIRLHPQAPRVTESDGGGGDPYRCGTCVFRTVTGGSRNYAKCMFGREETPVPDRIQVRNGPTVTVITPRATGAEASDVRRWWPGCADWKAPPSTL